MTGIFRCGHPRTPENSTRGYLHRNGNRYPACSLCMRVKRIAGTVDRQLDRWKTGREPLTRSQRILRGDS